MCESHQNEFNCSNRKTIPLDEAIGKVLAHDITEIRKDEFKGRAFKKGHVVRKEDVCHLQRLGKERLYVLNISDDEMHENDAAFDLAHALMGEGVALQGEPKEGKITLIAERNGLLRVDRDALLQFNMLGEVMCATLHDNTVVRKGQVLAGTRAIQLVMKKAIVEDAVRRTELVRRGDGLEDNDRKTGVIEVREIRKPKAGVVITGNEIYHGRIKDAFAPLIERKIKEFDGEIVGTYYAPDDPSYIEARSKELMDAGADLLITTGGMSVDPDDVTRFAIGNLGVSEMHYGSAVLPGAMILVGYIGDIPVVGIPACGIYHRSTVFDLVLPRILAGERIGRKELAELGHGGLCLHCNDCRYPICPFGK